MGGGGGVQVLKSINTHPGECTLEVTVIFF